jgi:protein-L-isoaspartate(D-aspartate) O-methyltransferase
MVDYLTSYPDRVTDKKVLAAMRRAPRHWFVPKGKQSAAYRPRPQPIGHGQTISQPYMVAFMTQTLGLGSESKVLEIGTGSGYQAAVLNELTPHVYSIEIIEPLAKSAKKRLKDRGYETIRVKHADGYFGWKKAGPFDAIIVTCAAGHVPPPLIKQLKPGGKMCIPVKVGMGFGEQLRLLEKRADGKPIVKALFPCRFVPMTGEIEGAR